MERRSRKLGSYIRSLIDGESIPFSEVQYPSMYEVVIYGDSFTPRVFIMHLVQRIFHKTQEEAIQIVEKMKRNARVSCGVFTKEIAETKVMRVSECAFDNNYPLRCTIRKNKQNVIEES